MCYIKITPHDPTPQRNSWQRNSSHVFAESQEKKQINPNFLLHHRTSDTDTHLPCAEFPVRRQPVRRVHEDFGNAQSFLDGLQLEPQQVPVDAMSFNGLSRAEKNVSVYQLKTDWNCLTELVQLIFTRSVRAVYASTASLNSWSFASRCNTKITHISHLLKLLKPGKICGTIPPPRIPAFLTDTAGSSNASMNLSVWFVGERINSVLPPRNILCEAMSQDGQTSLWTLKKYKNTNIDHFTCSSPQADRPDADLNLQTTRLWLTCSRRAAGRPGWRSLDSGCVSWEALFQTSWSWTRWRRGRWSICRENVKIILHPWWNYFKLKVHHQLFLELFSQQIILLRCWHTI